MHGTPKTLIGTTEIRPVMTIHRQSVRPRIGVFELSQNQSGPSRYVESILARVDPDEFEVVIFCRRHTPYQPREGVRLAPLPEATSGFLSEPMPEADEKEVPVQSFNFRNVLREAWRNHTPASLKLWTGFGRKCLWLRDQFRRQPVDLMHTNHTGCEESSVAARLAGIPCVLGTFHVDSTYDLEKVRSGPRHRGLEMLSNHCLDYAIAVSQATKLDWVRRTHLPAERVITVHNGIDVTQFRRRHARDQARQLLNLPTGETPIIGGVGRLEPAKGFSFLLEAFALLAGKYPHPHLALAGGGILGASLAARAKALGVAERVHFLGFRQDVQLFYDALDIFALSSLCEALPYVVLEAMASELPVVGTTVGGVAEMIVPGETGFLASPADASALAFGIGCLLDSAEMRSRFGQAGRQRVAQCFRQDIMVDKTLAIYRNLLGQRSLRMR